MTCCAICKITKKESIEETKCECPRFYTYSNNSIVIVWRGIPMTLADFMLKQQTGNPDAVAIFGVKQK